MALAQHNLSVGFNPLLSNPPAATRESLNLQAAAARGESIISVPSSNGPLSPGPLSPGPLSPAPAIVEERPQEKPEPKKGTWTASAARPQHLPKKNTSDMATAAKAAKALAGQSSGRLHGSGSASSLTLSNFPIPGAAMAMVMRPGLSRSTSFNRDDRSDSDSSSMRGLGINPSRSCGQLTNVTTPNRNAPRRPSFGSSGSGSKPGVGNSLGENIGFTFKGTSNFVHPNRQTPRTYTPLARSQNTSNLSIDYKDDDDVAVERMNSVTSDGGWKSGWSVGGGSFSGPSTGPNGENLEEGAQADDMAPEDVHETIFEEQDDQLDAGDVSPSRGLSPVRALSPARAMSPSRNSPPIDSSSASSSRTGRSLKSRKSSLSIRLRSRDDVDTAASSAPTSPIRSSLDKAVGIFARTQESEDPASRAASIAAARLAFEEKEAAKDRKYAEKEAKREFRRRTSEANDRPMWKRRPSNAVDSAFDSAEGSPTYSQARSSSIARTGSIARSNSINHGFGFSLAATTPAEESCDPLACVEEQDSMPETANFPIYEETTQADHSMFSAAYQEDQQQEPALFPPMRATPVEEYEGGLFPPVNAGLFPPPNAAAGPAVYTVDGKMYDEYGMPVHQIILPSHRRNDDDGVSYDSRGRRQSVTKQAKGKLNKFSAWGKTRLLRV